MLQATDWLESDGLGGFASGTATGVRTRRYHALLLVVTTPPTGRFVLVNGCEAWVQTPAGRFAISSQRYAPDTVYPDGQTRLSQFDAEPWPRWIYNLDDGTHIVQELFVPHETASVALAWKLVEPRDGVTLHIRPLLSGRDYHALHRENPAFHFEAEVSGPRVEWRPYPSVPATVAQSNGQYEHNPCWYRNFVYDIERERGLDCLEDLASPGIFHWDLSRGEAIWHLAAQQNHVPPPLDETAIEVSHEQLREAERSRRAQFRSRLERAGDAYLVRRGGGKTVVAGYPWFTDWGRDTFIALRGLCLSTGRLTEAGEILGAWAATVSEGMLPNRFPDHGDQPEFNSVDASLWFIVAVHDFLAAQPVSRGLQQRLLAAVEAILDGYIHGTRFGIRMDADGLLACGQTGSQLTWMDVKIDDWVVTPRIGKPVEVQALWLNALAIASRLATPSAAQWQGAFELGRGAFAERFWNEADGCLYDVVDVNHQPGIVDAAFRPNQIFAVGGLPLALLDEVRARRVVDQVERRLWTPLGLRTLAPGSPGYASHYVGDARERDGAYHQGTVWPWLLGAFVEAWVRVRSGTDAAKREAAARFVAPLREQLGGGELGHIPEIADAEPPHTPRGCPFQAWSVGEITRITHSILNDPIVTPLNLGSRS